MACGNGLLIIWLDSWIGIAGDYQEFKGQFNDPLRPVLAMPPNNINESFCYFEENVAPIKFVSTIADALTLVQNESDKRIVWISSGSLGQKIIPELMENYPRVYTYYLFCANIVYYRDWVSEKRYESCMQIFEHEINLLVRLIRDRSNEFIQLGNSYLQLNDGESARKCFVTAETLESSANHINQPQNPFLERLKALQGPNGLIEDALQLRHSNGALQ